jgi:uncharacterized protein (DUF697 family)
MNKDFKEGAEVVGFVAAKGFNAVGDEIKVVAKILEGLPNAVREIAFGFWVIDGGKARDDMPPEGKALLISALNEIKEASGSASELARKYYEHFYALLGVKPLPDFDAEKLSLLSGKNAQYALYVIMEYKAFFGDKAALKKADEIAKNLSVSANLREDFEKCIKAVVDGTSLKTVLNVYDLQLLRDENERLKVEVAERDSSAGDAKRKVEELERKGEVEKRDEEERKRKVEERKRKVEELERMMEELKKNAKNNQGNLDLKDMEKTARTAVTAATAAAVGIGASPIPFADFPILIGVQVTLVSTIAVIFKIDVKKEGLKTLVPAVLGVGGGGLLGRQIATSLLKFIPGVGTIAGGIIGGGVAGAMTYAMGSAFIELCKEVKRGNLNIEDIFSKKGETMLKKSFKTFAKEKKGE